MRGSREVYTQLAEQRLYGNSAAPTQAELGRLARLYPQDPLIRLHLERLSRGEVGDEIVMAEK